MKRPIHAEDAAPRLSPSVYPEPFAARVTGRVKKPLGDVFGLTTFGVNLTRLAPKSLSALKHAHAKQDEFIYVLEGTPTLVQGDERTVLEPGMCAGFKAGTGEAHHLINESEADAVYLEMGDRGPGDVVTYPEDDLRADLVDGRWVMTHKDGTPY